MVEDKTITFHSWLNSYMFITKREFKELSETSKSEYRKEYEEWRKS